MRVPLLSSAAVNVPLSPKKDEDKMQEGSIQDESGHQEPKEHEDSAFASDCEAEKLDLLHGDIVIDGETEIDDLWVAARIAHVENQSLEEHGLWDEARGKNSIEKTAQKLIFISDISEDEAIVAFPNESSSLDEKKDKAYVSFCKEDEKDQFDVIKKINFDVFSTENSTKIKENFEETVEELEELINKKSSYKVNDDFDNCFDDDCDSETQEGFDTCFTEKEGKEISFGVQKIPTEDIGTFVSEDVKLNLIGHIHSVLHGIFIIKALPPEATQPLDLGSVVCLEDRRVIGAVSDTFGPITGPLYVVYSKMADSEATRKNDEENLPIEGCSVYGDESRCTHIFGTNGEVPEYLKSGSFQVDDEVEDDDFSEEEYLDETTSSKFCNSVDFVPNGVKDNEPKRKKFEANSTSQSAIKNNNNGGLFKSLNPSSLLQNNSSILPKNVASRNKMEKHKVSEKNFGVVQNSFADLYSNNRNIPLIPKVPAHLAYHLQNPSSPFSQAGRPIFSSNNSVSCLPPLIPTLLSQPPPPPLPPPPPSFNNCILSENFDLPTQNLPLLARNHGNPNLPHHQLPGIIQTPPHRGHVQSPLPTRAFPPSQSLLYPTNQPALIPCIPPPPPDRIFPS